MSAATYRACFPNLTTINTYNSGISNYNPTVTIFGSSSKIVTVTRIQVNTINGTPQQSEFGLSPLSAVYVGGTSAALNAVPLVESSAAATATPLSWTAGPTSGGGAFVGYLEFISLLSQGTGPIVPSANCLYDSAYGKDGGQQIILNGAGEGLNLFFADNVVTIQGFIEWTEE